MTSVHDAILAAPFATLGIVMAGDAVRRIDFLPAGTPPVMPRTAAARRACEELQAYLADPRHRFRLLTEPQGTPFQQTVWRALLRIPVGETASYGGIARQLGTSPRAVGRACGANPLPIIVPCHRVLAKSGAGGFMHSREGDPLRIKQWLLDHEAAPR
jgi:methylated-DNA-[protein]-cysteine S-methyltransferase